MAKLGQGKNQVHVINQSITPNVNAARKSGKFDPSQINLQSFIEEGKNKGANGKQMLNFSKILDDVTFIKDPSAPKDEATLKTADRPRKLQSKDRLGTVESISHDFDSLQSPELKLTSAQTKQAKIFEISQMAEGEKESLRHSHIVYQDSSSPVKVEGEEGGIQAEENSSNLSDKYKSVQSYTI
mmetsp:Transcript_6961/g.11712  ORF Transcript_6961/g.11712 Transcript_6961/m.11712 type:complete len:184 (-) Transcript_6961:404-955(-)